MHPAPLDLSDRHPGPFSARLARISSTLLPNTYRPHGEWVKEKWSATAVWTPLDALTVSATVLRVGNWLDVSRDGMTTGLTAPGTTVVNLRGDYAVSDQVKLFARIDNLFNRHYENPTGFLTPGLGVFGGIRVASYGVQ